MRSNHGTFVSTGVVPATSTTIDERGSGFGSQQTVQPPVAYCKADGKQMVHIGGGKYKCTSCEGTEVA